MNVVTVKYSRKRLVYAIACSDMKASAMTRIQTRLAFRRHQAGAILFVSLIFLIVLTGLGLTALRMAKLEEKMTGNQREHSLAFEAAESALRQAEDYLNQATVPAFDDNPSAGAAGANRGLIQELCEPASPANWTDTTSAASCQWRDVASNTTRYIETRSCWLCSNFNWNQHSRQYSGNLAYTSTLNLTAPRYVIEQLPSIPLTSAGGSLKGGKTLSEITVFRITARGTSPSGTSTVILQETFRR